MSTANTVVVSCLLDDGTGTFPIDISSQVSLTAGIDLSNYGRADESTSASAAELSLTVKNDDGSFTTGVGFGSGGFGGGFFGGVCSIAKGQRIRFGLTVNGSYRNCFTGRIDSLSQSFEGAPGKRSDIAITAMDAMSDYGKRPMRSMLEQEIRLLSPAWFYPLGEAAGATSAGDTSGNGAPALAVTGTGTAPTFGVDVTGLVDSTTGVQFAAGKWLQSGTGNLITAPSTGGISAIFSTSTIPASITCIAYANGWSLNIDTSGRLYGLGPGVGPFTGPVVTDGRTHYAALSGNGVNSRLDLDGLAAGSGAAAASGVVFDVTLIGNAPNIASITAQFTGIVSNVAYYTNGAFTAAPLGTIYNAGFTTGTPEATDARLTRLASYAGTTAITTTASAQLMPGQQTSGSTLLDAFGVVADAELGVIYIDGSGQLRMQGRAYRTQKTAADLSQTGKALEPDSTSIVDDTQQAINYVSVNRFTGATQTWPLVLPATNLYPGSIELVVDSDSTALAYAQWIVGKHSSPGPRLPSVTTTNLRTSASASGLFAREIGDRLHLTGMPATTNPNLGDVTIEGYSMHLDRDTWTYTYNLLPWSLFQAATWDDATNSKWDTAVWAP